ncbi:hypothetical protein AQJ46_44510 [Streptomyces canus]|uniref:Uncharacterized protein n=1 Tax=Streptomyces canus TaxID=58343 RepID=A0A101RM23_9ACTN|nr:hypothetical protein AQJ46_44510 [Streptomyces canus]
MILAQVVTGQTSSPGASQRHLEGTYAGDAGGRCAWRSEISAEPGAIQFFMIRESGSVKLTWLGLRLGGGFPVGSGDGLLVAVAGAGMPAIVAGGLELDSCAGGLQSGETLFAAVELGGQVHLLAVGADGLVLGLVGGFRVGSQGLFRRSGDLGLRTCSYSLIRRP